MPGLLFAFGVSAAATFDVVPELTQEEVRTFPISSLLTAEQTMPIDVPAKALVIEYSADGPIELWISFPTSGAGGEPGSVGINPLHVLKARLAPLEHARISLDLTSSPAWYAGRRSFVLHILGEEGKTVRIHELTAVQPTLTDSFRAYIAQFFLDEPVLLSSINFLFGYRIADTSVTMLLGILFLCGSALCLSLVQKKYHVVILLAALFILFYDARFSLDLLKVTAADLREWTSEEQYRQLGPIHAIADFLKMERATLDSDMHIVMCFDGTDLLMKQLKYLLYPTPVLRPEDGWFEATHAVFIDTDHGVTEGGVAACGTFERRAELQKEFPERSRVIRFSAIPS